MDYGSPYDAVRQGVQITAREFWWQFEKLRCPTIL